MKKLISTALVSLAIILGVAVNTAPAAAQVYIRIGPPPPVVEHYGRPPHTGYVWVPGYQRWNGAGYVWVAGSWAQPPRPGAVWIAGHYRREPQGYVWVAGYWR